MKGAAIVSAFLMALATTHSLPAIYRASNPGVTHEAPLPCGYGHSIIIDNLLPSDSGILPAVRSPLCGESNIIPEPQQLPALDLPKTVYRAKNLGVTHEAELIGYEHPVIIENLEAAASSPALASVRASCADEEDTYVPPPPPTPDCDEDTYVPPPPPYVPPSPPAPLDCARCNAGRSMPPPAYVEDLPKTVYRAKNLGVTHETELIGYEHPVIIENLEPAPLSSAVSSLPCAEEPAPKLIEPATPAPSSECERCNVGRSLPPPAYVEDLPKTVYRAKNLGVTHEAELIGYEHPVIIENLEPAPSSPSLPAGPAVKSNCDDSPLPLPVQNLPKSVYRARNLGVTHEAELIGYEHPVIIDNLEPAPLSPVDISISHEESRSDGAPEPKCADHIEPHPPLVEPRIPVFRPCPPCPIAPIATTPRPDCNCHDRSAPMLPALNLPKTFYRAKNLGVTHETELIGYEHPVIIENLEPAPSSPALPSPIVAGRSMTDCEESRAVHSASERELPSTLYRASNPGVTHEAELIGHERPVIIENMEPAPGTAGSNSL